MVVFTALEKIVHYTLVYTRTSGVRHKRLFYLHILLIHSIMNDN